MGKVRISYSSSEEVKGYLDSMADKYNMTVSGVITMIVMQHKFQNESLEKFNQLQDVIGKIDFNKMQNVIPTKQPAK